MINNCYTYSGILPMTKLDHFDKKQEGYAVLLSERKSHTGAYCFSDLGQELSGDMLGRPWYGLKKGPWQMPDPKEGDQPLGYKWKLLAEDGRSVVYLKYFQDEAPFSHQRFDDCHWVRFDDVKEAAKQKCTVACLCCPEKKSLPLSRRTTKLLNHNPDVVVKPAVKKTTKDIPQKINSKHPYTTNVASTFVGDVHGSLDQMLLPLINKGLVKPTGKTVFIDMETTQRVKKPADGLLNKAIVEVPELKLDPKYKDNPVIFLGDYIDHCSLEKGLKTFYLMADLLNQQKDIQSTHSDYQALVSILGNHEMQIFKNGKSAWNLKGASSDSKKKYAHALHQLIHKGQMQMSYARGGILSTHTCVSTQFLEKLLEETDKNNVAAQDAMKYFLDQNNHTLVDLKNKKVKKLQINDAKTYQTQLETLSNYINDMSRAILFKRGKYDNGAALAKKSVLFTDPGTHGSITPLWAAPSKVKPVSSIQMAYGHCPGVCGRTAKFIDGLKYEHIRCYDGRSYREGNSPCYAEVSCDGKMSIIK